MGLEQVGSETRVEAEAETSERASDDLPGVGRTPTLDKRVRRYPAPSESEGPLKSTNLSSPEWAS